MGTSNGRVNRGSLPQTIDCCQLNRDARLGTRPNQSHGESHRIGSSPYGSKDRILRSGTPKTTKRSSVIDLLLRLGTSHPAGLSTAWRRKRSIIAILMAKNCCSPPSSSCKRGQRGDGPANGHHFWASILAPSLVNKWSA